VSAASLKSISTAWASFERLAIPHNAGEDQRREMRIAFYAGATTVLGTLAEISSDRVTEADGMNHLGAMTHEAHEFAHALTKAAQPSGSATH
jgi:hypothetical protein